MVPSGTISIGTEASSNEDPFADPAKIYSLEETGRTTSWKEPLILVFGTRFHPCPSSGSKARDIGPLTSQAGGSRVGRDNEISPAANLFPNSRASGGVKQPF